MNCKDCKGTSCISYIEATINGEEVITRLRYDFDDVDRNEFDIQIVKYGEEEDKCDWSYSYNTKYCPFCGEKLHNQREDNEDYGYLISFDTNVIFNEETVSTWLRLLKKEKCLELGIKCNDKLYTQKIKIKYDPNTGELL